MTADETAIRKREAELTAQIDKIERVRRDALTTARARNTSVDDAQLAEWRDQLEPLVKERIPLRAKIAEFERRAAAESKRVTVSKRSDTYVQAERNSANAAETVAVAVEAERDLDRRLKALDEREAAHRREVAQHKQAEAQALAEGARDLPAPPRAVNFDGARRTLEAERETARAATAQAREALAAAECEVANAVIDRGMREISKGFGKLRTHARSIAAAKLAGGQTPDDWKDVQEVTFDRNSFTIRFTCPDVLDDLKLTYDGLRGRVEPLIVGKAREAAE